MSILEMFIFFENLTLVSIWDFPTCVSLVKNFKFKEKSQTTNRVGKNPKV